MTLFEKLIWQPSDVNLFRKVRKLKGSNWSTAFEEIVMLRRRLLTLQNWRCVYCQSPIARDETGYRELDHILPKARTKNCTLVKGRSNDEINRRHTFGYSEFTFEPKNLVAACKRCNTQKGSFDPLRDRTKSFVRYPKEQHFLWVHPHRHRYSQHIKLDCDTWTYTKLTEQGDFVIRICKLDDSKTIEDIYKTRAMAEIAHAGSFIASFRRLASSVASKTVSIRHAARALEEKFGIDFKEAEDLLKLHIAVEKDGDVDDMVKATRALAAANSRLRTLPKIARNTP